MAKPEVLEVNVERIDHAPSAGEVARRRVWAFVGPVLLGLAIDAGDFVFTFLGPIGLFAIPLGMVFGYVGGGALGLSPTWRVAVTIATGIYWQFPFLGWIPVATIALTSIQIARPGALSREPFG